MILQYPLFAITLLFTIARAQNYCTTAPKYTSAWQPTMTFGDESPTVTPPLPCPGWYAAQEGYCCSGGINCSGSACTCPNGTLVYSLPLAPCVFENPEWTKCPGNMMHGLCCSGPGIFLNGPYNSTWSTAVCNRGTAVFNVTTAMDGTVGTTTLPPGISYTETRCFTCPLYTRTTSSKGLAARTMASEEMVAKVVAVGALLAAL